MLLAGATMLSRVVGYLRDAYVAWAFGAGPVTDAYVAAFTLPDFLLYLFAGGSISITFIALLTRYYADNRDEDAQQAFNVIVSVMVVVFGVVIALGEWFAPQFVRWWFHGFTEDQAVLCTQLTRILLPQPMFFLVGGVVAAVQQTKRQFLIPALAPIVYTVFIILGGVLFSSRMGIASLAVGATVGALVGPFLLNAIGARGAGIRYRFQFAPSDPKFKEWFWMSLPLMLGVSVVAADDWILRYFASSSAGDITRLNYAKRLLQVPIGVLGQAVGVASLPFFAKLWNEGKKEEFARSVNNAVSKLAAFCILTTGWLIPASSSLAFLAFHRGRLTTPDAAETGQYLARFCVSLVFWSVQGLYARAFYGAQDTKRPMIAATAVTAASIPVYWYLNHAFGSKGLVWASDIAIFLHTAVLAIWLHLRGMVGIGGLDWKELVKVMLATLAGRYILWYSPLWPVYPGPGLMALVWVTLLWGVAAAAVLLLFRSRFIFRKD